MHVTRPRLLSILDCRALPSPSAGLAATLVIASFGAGGCERSTSANPTKATREPASAVVVEQQHSKLAEVFEVEKIVELHGGPLLGAADIVRVTKAGTLFVADLGATSQVHEFTQTGGYTRTYGFEAKRINPEQPPVDFVVSGARVYVLYGRDLVAFGRTGAVETRSFLPFVPNSIAETSSGFCLAGVKGDTPKAIFCYDSSGALLSAFHERDRRLDLYRATPNRMVAASADAIYVVEPFEPTLSRYGQSGQFVSSHSLPDRGSAPLLELFARPRPLSQATRHSIRQNMHRFVAIWAFGNRVALLESHNDARLWALAVYNPEAGTFNRWPLLNLSEVQVSGLTLQHIVGSYDNGLIMSGEVSRGFKSLGHQPSLVFLAYHSPEPESLR